MKPGLLMNCLKSVKGEDYYKNRWWCAVDKEILERFLNKHVQLVNDENFVIDGKIVTIFNNCIAFYSHGTTKYLSFDRIKEIRPLGGKHL